MRSIEDVQFLKKITLLFLTPVLVLACSLFSIELDGCRREQTFEQLSDSRLKGVLTTDRDCYREGEVVNISFTLENISTESLSLRNSEGPVIQIVFLEFNGPERYEWQDTVVADQSLSHIDIQPGDSYRVQWTIVPRNYYGRGVRATVVSNGAEILDITLGISGPR
jgi:hypothetical protein